MEPLNKVFTLAAAAKDSIAARPFGTYQSERTLRRGMAREYPETCNVELLFSALNDVALPTIDVLQDIAHDPLFQEIVGDEAVITPWDVSDKPGILVTTNLLTYVVKDMPSATRDDSILVYRKGGTELQEISLYDNYYQCTKPHKIVLGCTACVTAGKGLHDCPVKELTVNRLVNKTGRTLPELKETLKNRKTSIAGYTFVSPRLTTPDPFYAYFRGVDFHDFQMIEENSGHYKAGNDERKRIKKFRETACANCFVEKCYGWSEKGCEGNYPKTLETAYDEILSRINIPFSDKQLGVLLQYTGKTYRRVKRRIYATTFRTRYTGGDAELVYGLSRKHENGCSANEFIPFKSYKDAAKFLQDDGQTLNPAYAPKMTKQLKALIVEHAATERIRCRSGWGSRWGFVWYIDYRGTSMNCSNPDIRLHHCARNGRQRTSADDFNNGLKSIYERHGRFEYLYKNKSSFRR